MAMRPQTMEYLARGIGQALANLYHGARAERDYRTWANTYTQPQDAQQGASTQQQPFPKITGGARQQGPQMQGPQATPARGVDESAMADLVTRLGDNPMASRYLEGADMLYRKGVREREQQQAAEAEAKAQAEMEMRQRAELNQAIAALAGQHGQRPTMQAIPDVARAFQGQGNIMLGGEGSQFEQIPQAPPKVDMGAGYVDLGNGRIGQIGYDDFGNQTVVPLPEGAKPYREPKQGGAGVDPALTWAMNQALGGFHTERQAAGNTSKDLHDEYRQIQQLPTRAEINAAINAVRSTGDESAAQRLNTRYGDVIGPDEKGVYKALPGTRLREDALADWRKRKRENETRYGRATEGLKSAATSGRKDPAGRTTMRY